MTGSPNFSFHQETQVTQTFIPGDTLWVRGAMEEREEASESERVGLSERKSGASAAVIVAGLNDRENNEVGFLEEGNVL